MLAYFFEGDHFNQQIVDSGKGYYIAKIDDKELAGCVLDDSFFEDCMLAFSLISKCAGIYYSSAEADRLEKISLIFSSFLSRDPDRKSSM